MSRPAILEKLSVLETEIPQDLMADMKKDRLLIENCRKRCFFF